MLDKALRKALAFLGRPRFYLHAVRDVMLDVSTHSDLLAALNAARRCPKVSYLRAVMWS